MYERSIPSKPVAGFKMKEQFSQKKTSNLRQEKAKQESNESRIREELIAKQYDNYAGLSIDKEELVSYVRRGGRPIITDSLLSEPWIKETIEEAFYSPQLFRKHSGKLRKSENFFEFVLGKLTSNNKNLEFLWRKKKEMLDAVYEVEPPMPEEGCRMLQARLGGYRSQQIIQQLQLLGVREKMCGVIAQISENNLTRAVSLALEGNLESYKFTIPSFQRPEDQCIFLHQWLMNPQRRLLVMRLSSEEELDLFTLSLRFRCFGLFEMFVRYRGYIQRTIHNQVREWRGRSMLDFRIK